MGNFRRASRGDRSLLASAGGRGAAFGLGFELNSEREEILDRRELLGLVGDFIGDLNEAAEGPSDARDDRSVKGFVTVLSGDCTSFSSSEPAVPVAFCSSCSSTAAYSISISSCARRLSYATTDSSIVATLPFPDRWDLDPRAKLLQDLLKLFGRLGLGRLAEIGVTGLGSILTDGFAGLIISTCKLKLDD